MRPSVLLALCLAAAARPAAAAELAAASRFERRAALVAELRAEGAETEARSEEARLLLDFPAEASSDIHHASCTPRPATCVLRPASSNLPPSRDSGLSTLFSRLVVGFYRTFVGPAIGSRCALEPSCSHYFLEASRKHGLLGIPMTADRFVREPVVSAPDRPWVRTPSGALRHPDPVEDHDDWL